MFESIVGNTFSGVYSDLINVILNSQPRECRYAHDVNAKNKPTSELTLYSKCVQFTVLNPRFCCYKNPIRQPSFNVGMKEGVMLFSDSNNVDYVPWYRPFSRDGKTSYSMYGQFINPKIDRIVNKLRVKPITRQCVFTIYNMDINVWDDDVTDVPCTLMGIFDISGTSNYKALNLTIMMRSNDLYLGTPYNMMMFSYLQQVVANELGLELGSYTHFVNNLHIYYSNISQLEDSLKYPFEDVIMSIPYGVSEARRVAKSYMENIDEENKQKASMGQGNT
jgi:thymidylate synthase